MCHLIRLLNARFTWNVNLRFVYRGSPETVTHFPLPLLFPLTADRSRKAEDETSGRQATIPVNHEDRDFGGNAGRPARRDGGYISGVAQHPPLQRGAARDAVAGAFAGARS